MKIKKLVYIVLSFTCIYVQAQEYEFTATSGTYEDLENTIPINNEGTWDDPEYSIPIGFDFEIGGETYNTLYFPEFSEGNILSTDPGEEEGIFPMLMPIHHELLDSGGETSLSYKVEGQAGNQILKIEWSNVGFWEADSDDDHLNFQVWVYEEDSRIEFHYGSSETNYPYAEDDFSGPVVMFSAGIDFPDSETIPYPIYWLSGDPSNPDLITATEETDPPSTPPYLDEAIPEGTIYRFTPETMSTPVFQEQNFSIYPNPVSTTFSLQTQTIFLDEYQATIYTLEGKAVQHLSDISEQIDVSGLASGMYLLRLEKGNEIQTAKFIKK